MGRRRAAHLELRIRAAASSHARYTSSDVGSAGDAGPPATSVGSPLSAPSASAASVGGDGGGDGLATPSPSASNSQSKPSLASSGTAGGATAAPPPSAAITATSVVCSDWRCLPYAVAREKSDTSSREGSLSASAGARPTAAASSGT